MNEFFPPTEDELKAMIGEVRKKMEDATDRAEYDRLYDQLKDLNNQLQQLTIKNNAL